MAESPSPQKSKKGGPVLSNTAIKVFVTLLASKVLMFGSVLIMTRSMSVDSYGIFVSCLSVSLFAGVFVTLGSQVLVIRLVATYAQVKDWRKVKGLLTHSYFLVAALWLLASTALLGAFAASGHAFSTERVESLVLMLPLVLVAGLTAMKAAALRGLNLVASGLAVESVVLPAAFAALLIFSQHFYAAQLTADQVMAIRLTAAILALVAAQIVLSRVTQNELTNVNGILESKSWILSSLPLSLFGFLTIASGQVDILLLSAIDSNASAGIYQATARAGELVAFVSTVLALTLQPTIARLHASGATEELRRALRRNARISTLASSLLAAPLMLIPETILQLAYGQAFGAGSVSLLILCVGHIAASALGPGDHLLNMTGNEKYVASTLGVTVLLCSILSLLIIPMYGLQGAAISAAISLVLWRALMAMVAIKLLRVSPAAF